MKHKNMTASQENVYCTSDCRRSFFSLGLKVSCCCHVGQHDEHLHMAMQVLQSVAGQDQKSLALVNCSRLRASYDFRVISLITTCFPYDFRVISLITTCLSVASSKAHRAWSTKALAIKILQVAQRALCFMDVRENGWGGVAKLKFIALHWEGFSLPPFPCLSV